MSIGKFLNLKKITCGLLTSIMIIGMCPVAVFADQDIPIDDGIPVLTNGDNFVYNENVTNENNVNDITDVSDVNDTDVVASKHGQIKVRAISNTSENWELNVPAELSSGESGTVTLSGMWPANRTINITCDSNVVLTSNIDRNDTISVGITFSGLSLKGSNSANVSGTGNIAVANVDTSTLFGSWDGSIKYYIGSEDIVLPTPTMVSGSDWYKSTQPRDTITSIKFVDSYTPTGSEDETWYADKDNGTVPETQITAYRTGTEIIVAGNGSGKIMANKYSAYMFSHGASNSLFKNLKSLDISILDTSEVINVKNMFYNCGALTSLDLSNFNTSKVTDMSGMFNYCKALTSLDLSNFDTSNVTYMKHMFYSCFALTSLNISSFDTSKVINMNSMFSYCMALESLDVSNLDTSNVTNMSAIFNSCMHLKSLDVSNFNTFKVTNMGFMFQSCQALTSIYVGSGWNTDTVTDSEYMFTNCVGLPNYNSSVVDKTNAHTGPGGYLTLKV